MLLAELRSSAGMSTVDFDSGVAELMEKWLVLSQGARRQSSDLVTVSIGRNSLSG